MNPLLTITDVWKTRGPNAVLKGIDLAVEPGQVVCLLGPSGAGKSTLLRCINALDPCDRGLIRVTATRSAASSAAALVPPAGAAIARQRADIGMVFQNFNLFPHLSVLDNITDAPMRVRGERRAAAEERARDLLERVGLDDKATPFRANSRVASSSASPSPARWPCTEADVVRRADLGARPASGRRGARRHPRLAATGMTMVIVTHEVQFAREIADSSRSWSTA